MGVSVFVMPRDLALAARRLVLRLRLKYLVKSCSVKVKQPGMV
jgi:hypothetical protein